MKLSKDLFIKFANTYINFFKNADQNVLKEAKNILNIFNIQENDGFLVHNKFKYSLLKKPFIDNKIIPLDLNIIDIKAIESTLNKDEYIFESGQMSPLFDGIGWVLDDIEGKWKIHFVGGPNYDLWIDPIEDEIKDLKKEGWMKEDFILDASEINWKDYKEIK